MSVLVISHQVADFDKWKDGFDANEAPREHSGCSNFRVFSKVGDPNSVTIMADVDNMDEANEFLSSPDLKEAMEKAGVVGAPDISFYNEA